MTRVASPDPMRAPRETTAQEVAVSCPDCLGRTRFVDDAVICVSCHREFHVIDGIPILRNDSDTYYGEFPQEEMHQLLDAARYDLEGAIRGYLRKKDAPPRLGDYILGRGRAGWQFLLPVDGNSTVLDLGCGWGSLTWNLAHFCGHVVACDTTLERMQLLGIRRQLDQLGNLQLVCAGDSKYLPFPHDSFDAVILNGVLEWIPSGLPGNPRSIQVKFLREVRRVLKSDGCLFLGIENRYAWKTWAINPDGHTGLRFVPWMPRTLANLYSRLHVKGGYRNYLYGPNQYRRLLAECGFADTQFYVPSPGYHHPSRMIDFRERDELQEAFTRQEESGFRRFRQKVKGYLSARFPDAFGIIACDEQRASYLHRILDHIREQMGETSKGTNRFSYRMNGEMGIVTVIVREPGEPFILKLPIHDRGRKELQSEAHALRQIHADKRHALASYARLFATIKANGKFGGHEYFAYSLLPGVSGDRLPLSSDLFYSALRNSAKFLAQLHLKSPDRGATLDELLRPVCEAVLTLAVDNAQRATVNRIVDQVLRRFNNSFGGAVWGHGDFKLANCIFDPQTAELTGVIDWGTGVKPELPGYDLSFLLISSNAMRTNTQLPDQLKQQRQIGVPARYRDVLSEFAETTQQEIDDERYQALIGYQWLKRLAPLADEYETMRYNHRYLQHMFAAMD